MISAYKYSINIANFENAFIYILYLG